MATTADRIAELRDRRRRAAVATLVAASGGAIRRLGETMWVDDHGDIVGSVTIGGCVDGRTVRLAEEVLQSGHVQRVSIPLGEEDAWAFGMTCAGTVELLVEPVDPADPGDAITLVANAVASAVRDGRSVVELATMDRTPRRLAVIDGGEQVGTLGDADLDAALRARVPALLDARTVGVISTRWNGAVVELFARVHASPPPLVIVGATDVAVTLVGLASALGFHTTVVDGRERWATAARFPTASEVRVGMPSEIVASVPLGPTAALVLLSHDFKYDLPVLEVALRSRVGYIGVLGSRRRADAIREALRGTGVDDEAIARLHMPIGLDIGAKTSGEIAVSVLAELIAVRAGRNHRGDA